MDLFLFPGAAASCCGWLVVVGVVCRWWMVVVVSGPCQLWQWLVFGGMLMVFAAWMWCLAFGGGLWLFAGGSCGG
jgi:hypothetical protein